MSDSPKEVELNPQSLTSQGAMILVAKMFAFSLSILLPLLVVRLLAKEQVGEYRQVFLFVANAVSVLPLGFSLSAYYFLGRMEDSRGAVVLNILIFNFLVGGAAFATLALYPDLLSNLFGNPELERFSLLVGVTVWLWITSSVLEILAIANREVRLASVFIVVSQFSKLAFMTTAVAVYATVEAFLYAAILQGILQVTLLTVYLISRFPHFWRDYQWKLFRHQLSYALPFGAAALLYTGQTDIHNYFVSHTYSAEDFAIYSQGCFQLPLIALIYESVNSVAIPYLSKLQRQGNFKEMLRVTVSATEKLSLAYFPLFVFLFIAAEEFITILFTSAYRDSAPIFRVNLLMIPLLVLVVDPAVRAFKGLGTFLTKLRVLILLLMIPTLWFAVPVFGMVGSISVVVAFVSAEKVVLAYRTLRMLGFTRGSFALFGRSIRILMSALISGLLFLAIYLPLQSWVWTEHLRDFDGSQFVYLFLGLVFLGVAAVLYSLIYLILLGKFQAVDPEDRRRLTEFMRKHIFSYFVR